MYLYLITRCQTITRQVPDTSRVALAYLSVPADPLEQTCVCPTPTRKFAVAFKRHIQLRYVLFFVESMRI